MAVLLPLLLHVVTVTAPPCPAASLSLAPGGAPGDFNGMSHSGTLLRLRNRGRTPCAIPAQPRLAFLDLDGRTLPIATTQDATATVALPPGASAAATLRWVSGPVYDRSRCYASTRIALLLPSGRLEMPLGAHICGEAGRPVRVDSQPFSR